MSTAPAQISVAIIICSRQRPKLLTRALESLTRLNHPENCAVRFAVVENDSPAIYGELIARFAQKMPIEHVVEPRPGLCHARNKALETALDMGVDWLGGVDDDQVIDADWLLHMVKAIRSYPDTDMFVGQWRRIEPEDTPSWYPKPTPPSQKRTGSLITSAAGGNTVFSARVFAPAGMGLRYDERFVSIPGEDTEFGLHYLGKGGKMRQVREAITTEEVHPERNSLKDRAIRTMWAAYSQTLCNHIHSHLAVASFWSLQTIYRGTVLGLLNVALGAVLWPIDTNWGKNRLARGRLFLAEPRGVLRYYFGKPEGLYQTRTGR
jgi:GT2 family glycosyltransferase